VDASLRMRRETSWLGLVLMDCNVCGDGPGVQRDCVVFVCVRGMWACTGVSSVPVLKRHFSGTGP